MPAKRNSRGHRCAITGKRPNRANNVTFSAQKNKRWQYPNIQTKKVFVPELNRTVQIRMSTKAMRTIDKIGLMAFLKKQGLKLKDVVK